MTEINRDISSVNKVNFKGNKGAKKTDTGISAQENGTTPSGEVTFCGTGAYGKAALEIAKNSETAKSVRESAISFMGNPDLAMVNNMEFNLRYDEGKTLGVENPYLYALKKTNPSK